MALWEPEALKTDKYLLQCKIATSPLEEEEEGEEGGRGGERGGRASNESKNISSSAGPAQPTMVSSVDRRSSAPRRTSSVASSVPARLSGVGTLRVAGKDAVITKLCQNRAQIDQNRANLSKSRKSRCDGRSLASL